MKKIYECDYIRRVMQTLPKDMDEDEKHHQAYTMLHENKQLLDTLHQLATKDYKTDKYEYRSSVHSKKVKSGRLKYKKVFILQTRKTGKTYFDRAGLISY